MHRQVSVLNFSLLLFLFVSSHFLLPTSDSYASEVRPMPNVPLPAAVTTYDDLLAAIRSARHASEARIEAAVEQEKVREAWEIGKLIDEHVLQHKERADYGKQVLEKLSQDLGTSASELRRMLEFARAYPISAPARKLSWAHYRELLALNELSESESLAERAEKGHWTRDQVREEVQKRKAANGNAEQPAPSLAPVQPGKIGTYKIVKATVGPGAGKFVIDLGFSNYYKTSKDLRFQEGDIIEIIPATKGAGSVPSDKIKFSKRTTGDLFTYTAHVFDVMDGDTFKAVIDLGFGVRSVQVLRLRGIDAPEIESKDGKEAKIFFENLMAGKSVIVKTSKSDKYYRYLADVFISLPAPPARQKEGPSLGGNVSIGDLSSYVYVNQKLVAEGLAVTVRD